MKKILLSFFVISILVPTLALASVASSTISSSKETIVHTPSKKKIVKKPIIKVTNKTNKSTISGCVSVEGFSSITGVPCSGKIIAPVAPAWDSCKNIEGIQSVIPVNMQGDGNGNCFTIQKTEVTAPVKTGYQICSEAFPNETWDGTYSNDNKYNCVCLNGYVLNSTRTACEVKPVDNSAQISYQKYQAQYQAVQAKIKPLQDQYNEIETIITATKQTSSPCPGLAGGEQGIKCLLMVSQEGDISGYENAILGDFLKPVTDASIAYENKLDDLQQQIFQIKMKYHQDIANLSGSAVGMSVYNGQSQNLLNSANTKIDSLNQQIQFILTDYKNGITP